ncbi:MAG TPA: 30S ribosomal protein S13 [Patescibacteria group bacterium]|nr:30S ribosomal protein S13 [Patescibacteria group bacterium]
MRIVGVNIPDDKRIDIALSYIYGIGRSNTKPILEKAGIDFATRTKDLTEEQVKILTQILDKYKIEGDLKTDIAATIRRLKETGSYRGKRHAAGLPSRGQRTRSNARTKRGKRVTIGAIKKEVMAKMESAQKAKESGK